MFGIGALVRRLLPADRSAELTFALNEISELRQQVRLLLAASPEFKTQMAQTYDSFDTQWDLLPSGEQLLGSVTFDREGVQLLEKYTGMPATWFRNKAILDVGAGNGRWSYTLAKLGATVTAVDQSAAGLDAVQRQCAAFAGFTTLRHDILEPLPDRVYDAVWSFGVAHHTGDTRRALKNMCHAVKPGGYLFAMIYGEPRPGRPGEYMEINEYVKHRRAIAGMTTLQKIDYLRARFPEELVNGAFDAFNPKINDLHRFDELREWLLMWGLTDIERPFDNRNIFIKAIRKP